MMLPLHYVFLSYTVSGFSMVLFRLFPLNNSSSVNHHTHVRVYVENTEEIYFLIQYSSQIRESDSLFFQEMDASTVRVSVTVFLTF